MRDGSHRRDSPSIDLGENDHPIYEEAESSDENFDAPAQYPPRDASRRSRPTVFNQSISFLSANQPASVEAVPRAPLHDRPTQTLNKRSSQSFVKQEPLDSRNPAGVMANAVHYAEDIARKNSVLVSFGRPMT